MPRCQWNRAEAGGPGSNAMRRRALAALASVLLVGACEGDTLYDVTDPGGPGGPTPPGPGRGELVTIPGIGTIADLLVEPGSQRVFLSNLGQHRLEVLSLDALQFTEDVRVGSQPWGLALNLTGDTLIVANSGGTNVSFVPTAALTEDVARRFDLPRVTLYDYQEQDDDGSVTITLDFHNYVDRPLHVVQDFRGRLIYSALSSAAMPIGTIRVAERKPGWEAWDTRLLFPCCVLSTGQDPTNRAISPVPFDSASVSFAIANVDSISLQVVHEPPFAGATGNVIIWDHVPGSLPGSPGRTIQTPPLPILDAIQHIYDQGSDIIAYAGAAWNVPAASAVADTTYVAVSGDRRWVAFGELPASTPGRVILWSAADSALSRVEDIQDMLNNSADRISGIALNQNGSLGVARGGENTYFFGSDLRLQGSTRASAAGGRGADLLPGATTNRTLAFEPTGQATLRVLETTHYTVAAEIGLREAITGPFRVGPARPGTDACPANFRDGPPTCVVATVYGVTNQRRLHVVDVLHSDIP
jgi:hypothetical protein